MNDRPGGSYVVQPDGSAVREGGTVPHPAGDAPRTADGQVVRDGVTPEARDGQPPEAPLKPVRTPRKEG